MAIYLGIDTIFMVKQVSIKKFVLMFMKDVKSFNFYLI